MMLNIDRCHQLVGRAISAMSLSLEDLVVLTESATGAFALTASIAAVAGARHVFALTRDSPFGSASEAKRQTCEVAAAWGVLKRVTVIERRDDPCIGTADIVTNLGFVRPISGDFIRRLKPTAVIPLMFETWEFRSSDIDIKECRLRDIPILGTNEAVPELNIFSYIGPLAVKLLLECEIEMYRAVIIVLGSGAFGDVATNSINASGATVQRIDPSKGQRLADRVFRSVLTSADAILVIEHHDREPLIKLDDALDLEELKAMNPGLTFVHICGNLDRQQLASAGFVCWPDRFASAGYMTATTAHVGPRPLIDLHVGGLKVGELLARARQRGLSRAESEAEALRHPICQDFPLNNIVGLLKK